MIEVEGLRKSYGDVVAVDGVSFTAPSGAVFGLLGPNGAGKTTTIGCVSGLVTPGGGRVRVCGKDVLREPREARSHLGVVPQELALYEDLSGRRNLDYWAAAFGLDRSDRERRVAETLERVGLLDRADDDVETYSGGMKRRLNFACGVVHEPDVLLLDEPTVGVDPQSRVRLLDLVDDQADAGTCVLYTTHYMEEAQRLCDRVAIMDRGRVLAEGTLEELRERTGERDVVRLTGVFDPAAVRPAVDRLEEAEVAALDEGQLVLSMEGASRRLPDLFGALEAAGCKVTETTLTEPSLESLFIELTGRELRE